MARVVVKAKIEEYMRKNGSRLISSEELMNELNLTRQQITLAMTKMGWIYKYQNKKRLIDFVYTTKRRPHMERTYTERVMDALNDRYLTIEKIIKKVGYGTENNVASAFTEIRKSGHRLTLHRTKVKGKNVNIYHLEVVENGRDLIMWNKVFTSISSDPIEKVNGF